MTARLASVPLGVLVMLSVLGSGVLAACWGMMLVAQAASGDRARLLAVGLLGIVVLAGVMVASSVLLRAVVAHRVGLLRAAALQMASGQGVSGVPEGPRDELGALAGAIREAGVRLARVEAERHEFLARVSHELRTPLTIIRQAAFTELRRASAGVGRERLVLIDSEADRLGRLVEDLMLASSLAVGGLRIRPRRCAVADLLEAVSVRFAGAAVEAGVALSVVAASGDGVEVDVDPDRWAQLVGNLVTNAIRHAPAGSVVRVAASASAGQVAVDVANRAERVEPGSLARAFEPFMQGAASTGSVGLGLPVARQLARLHGGDLRLEAADGWVSATVLLPCHVQAPAARVTAAAGAQDGAVRGAAQ